MRGKKPRRVHDARDTGTPETRAKLRPNYLEGLQRAGRLSGTQFQAATELRDAFEFAVRPVAMKISDPARVPNPSNLEDSENRRLDRLWGQYLSWWKKMKPLGLDYFAVVDILVYGITCSETDRRRHNRKGTALRTLQDSLALYCRMMGWPIAA